MAGRIPQTFIDELLDRLDIVEVIDRRVPLKKSGRNYTARCPFHEEKTPSFSVNQEKQFYYCFGCGAGGNAVGFVMDYDRVDFPQAIETLADSAGLQVPREAAANQEAPKQKRNLYTVLEKAADYYTQQLKSHPRKQPAIDYLRSRGLSGEIARDFDIGYAPPGWDNLLSALGHSDEDRQLLIDAGMLITKPEENKLYDRFRDRIMFPIRDNRGRIIAFGGRVLGDDKPKYLNSPETAVFNKGRELYGLYQSRKSHRQLQRLLVVEGYMDVVALAQHGINWAAATLGTATSTDHLKQIFRQCGEVIFCFDGDEAGKKAAVRALEAALPQMQDGRRARFLFLPQGEDPDSLVRRIGATQFIHLVDNASPLEEFLFDSQSEQMDTSAMDAKARLCTLAAPLIDKLPNGVFKELMMASLAEKTGLPAEKLQDIITAQRRTTTIAADVPATQQVEHHTTTATPKQRPAQPKVVTSTRDPVLYALALLLHNPKAANHIDPPGQLAKHTDPNIPLLSAVLELLHKRPDSTPAMLIGHWYGEPWGETLQQLLQMDHLIPETGTEQELLDTLNHLTRQHQHWLLDNQVDQIASKPYSQLSEEEKLLLKQALSSKHEAPPNT